jgi:hypothetical protein
MRNGAFISEDPAFLGADKDNRGHVAFFWVRTNITEGMVLLFLKTPAFLYFQTSQHGRVPARNPSYIVMFMFPESWQNFKFHNLYFSHAIIYNSISNMPPSYNKAVYHEQ